MQEGRRGNVNVFLPIFLLPLVNLIMAAATGTSAVEGYTHPSPLIPCLPDNVVIILFAMAEELFYRWFVLKKVFFQTTKLKPVISILIVSILFAGMHLWNLQTSQTILPLLLQVFSAFCFSIWAGAVMWKTDRIWIPLLAHVLLNATAGNAQIPCMSAWASVSTLIHGVAIGKAEKTG